MKYLNKLFYPLPDTHCTKPIEIAKGVASKNKLACSTKYQQAQVKSKKDNVRKAAKEKYCATTPISPQENYYQCRYGQFSCVSQAFAEASGQAGIVTLVLGFFVVLIAVNCMGLPKTTNVEQEESDGDLQVDFNFSDISLKS